MQAPQAAAPAPQDPGQGAPQGGSAQELVAGIHEGLSKLADLVGKTPQISPEEKQMLGQIIQGYESFVEKLGQPASGGAPEPQGAPMQGPSSMEAGANPNARPM